MRQIVRHIWASMAVAHRICVLPIVSVHHWYVYRLLGIFSRSSASHGPRNWIHVSSQKRTKFDVSYMVMLACIQGYFFRKRALALGIYSSGVSLGGALCICQLPFPYLRANNNQ